MRGSVRARAYIFPTSEVHMAGGRRPDYNVSVVVKDSDVKGSIGVAWKSDDFEKDGRISIRLNPFVNLVSSPGLYVTLFPIGADGSSYQSKDSGKGGGSRRSRSDDDEIPF